MGRLEILKSEILSTLILPELCFLCIFVWTVENRSTSCNLIEHSEIWSIQIVYWEYKTAEISSLISQVIRWLSTLRSYKLDDKLLQVGSSSNLLFRVRTEETGIMCEGVMNKIIFLCAYWFTGKRLALLMSAWSKILPCSVFCCIIF